MLPSATALFPFYSVSRRESADQYHPREMGEKEAVPGNTKLDKEELFFCF